MDFSHLLWYIVCYQAKEVTRMAKLTVKQLYYGDEYGVMGQVIKSLLQNPPPTVTIDPNTYRELEIVRQTLTLVALMIHT